MGAIVCVVADGFVERSCRSIYRFSGLEEDRSVNVENITNIDSVCRLSKTCYSELHCCVSRQAVSFNRKLLIDEETI